MYTAGDGKNVTEKIMVTELSGKQESSLYTVLKHLFVFCIYLLFGVEWDTHAHVYASMHMWRLWVISSSVDVHTLVLRMG